jgi:hypothetical protein
VGSGGTCQFTDRGIADRVVARFRHARLRTPTFSVGKVGPLATCAAHDRTELRGSDVRLDEDADGIERRGDIVIARGSVRNLEEDMSRERSPCASTRNEPR